MPRRPGRCALLSGWPTSCAASDGLTLLGEGGGESCDSDGGLVAFGRREVVAASDGTKVVAEPLERPAVTRLGLHAADGVDERLGMGDELAVLLSTGIGHAASHHLLIAAAQRLG